MSRPSDQYTFNTVKMYCKDNDSTDELVSVINSLIDKSLEGMIPAENVVTLDWPQEAKYAQITYYDIEGTYVDESYKITRPTPQWQPKVGDPVFCCHTHTIYTVESVANIMAHENIGWAMLKNRSSEAVLIKDLKPATIDQMNIPWNNVRML